MLNPAVMLMKYRIYFMTAKWKQLQYMSYYTAWNVYFRGKCKKYGIIMFISPILIKNYFNWMEYCVIIFILLYYSSIVPLIIIVAAGVNLVDWVSGGAHSELGLLF